MIINVTTIAVRTEHYIHRTLDSLARSDVRDIPLNLILGSRDSSHVEQYRNIANIVSWSQKPQFLAREGDLRRNCTVNAIRALMHGDDERCLTCEDDVFFQKTWYGQLMDTVAEIECKDYILNLAFGSIEPSDHRYQVHAPTYLYGAQGLFYPNRRLRHAVGAYVERNIWRGLNDMLVGKYAKKYAVLYNTGPALIWHIGGRSSFAQRSENRAELS